jgi:methylglyoxal synthase
MWRNENGIGDLHAGGRHQEGAMMTHLHVRRHVALVAHDNKKAELLSWAEFNRETLREHHLYATGTTGTMLEFELGLPITRFLSGPVGGDQQIGARIAQGQIDVLIFFWDPLEAQPHDTDVKALLRLATLWNITIACNVASADFVISSPLLTNGYRGARPEGYDQPPAASLEEAVYS